MQLFRFSYVLNVFLSRNVRLDFNDVIKEQEIAVNALS